jgi:hypothetical protein
MFKNRKTISHHRLRPFFLSAHPQTMNVPNSAIRPTAIAAPSEPAATQMSTIMTAGNIARIMVQFKWRPNQPRLLDSAGSKTISATTPGAQELQ